MQLNDLPFVHQTEDAPIDLWIPGQDGDWDRATNRGRNHAQALLRYMIETGDTAVLGQVARAMQKTGRWGGVETGFFQVIAEWAVD